MAVGQARMTTARRSMTNLQATFYAQIIASHKLLL
jgi:hypothetical protein